jgi:DNA-directed RNA polymerase subunit RPC12/RpoP
MAYTRTIITYKCPRCRADIGRRFGLMSTLTITCPYCEAKVRIDRNVIAQNWGFNFAWVSGLLIWLVLGVAALASPQFAAMIGNKTLPAATPQNRVVIALFCVIPSLLSGLIIGGVGMLLGTIVAMGAAREENSTTEAPTEPQEPVGAPAAGPQPPRPRQRGLLVRAFFVLLWPVVFFCGAATVLGAVLWTPAEETEPAAVVPAGATALVGSPLGQGPLLTATSLVADKARAQALKDKAAAKTGEKVAPWLVLGTLAVFVLGCVGFLPATGGKLKDLTACADADAAHRPDAPPRQRRSLIVRGIFVVLWPAVFFIAAAMTMSALAGAFAAETEALQQELHQQSAEKHTGWIFLVSLVLFVMGCLGVLPCTAATKKVRSEE